MKKRRLSILLSIVMLLSLLPTTALAATYYDKVKVNDIDLQDGYYLEDNSSTSATTGANTAPTTYVAWYKGGVLTLNGYDGTDIAVQGLDVGDLTIKLIGDNTITPYRTGIQGNSKSGSITITADSSGGKLTINVSNSTQSVYGIDGDENSVTITGSADVTIIAKAENASDNSYGIKSNAAVSILGDASVNITSKTPSSTRTNACYGIYSKKDVTIDTEGTIQINVHDEAGTAEAASYGVYSLGNLTLTKVGGMTVKWKKAGVYGAPYYPITASFSDTDHAINEDTTNCYASYRFGTPRIVTVQDGTLTGTGVKYENGSGYFLAGDKVNITPAIKKSWDDQEIPFKEWTSSDVTLDKSATTASNSFTVPTKNVTVTATHSPFVGTPTFTPIGTTGTEGTLTFKTVVKANAAQEGFRLVKEGNESSYISIRSDTTSTSSPYEYSYKASIYTLDEGNYYVVAYLNNDYYLGEKVTVSYTAAPAGNYSDSVTLYNANKKLIGLGDGECLTANDATAASSYTGGSSYVARYDKSSGTLYLNGYHGVAADGQIYADGDLNIVVENDSSFTTSVSATNNLYGIQANGKLNISGSGKLTVTANGNGNVYGIYANEGVTISAPLNVQVGKVDSSKNGPVYGIYTQSGAISLSDGDKTITATGGAEFARGVYNDAKTSSTAADNGNINISGKLTVNLSNGSNNRGISSQGGVITLNDAEVNIPSNHYYGIYNYNGNVIIENGSKVELASTISGGEGICASIGGDLIIKNSTVKVSAHGYAANPEKGNLSINDSIVDLTRDYNHYRVVNTANDAANTIDLSGSGSVTLTASGNQTGSSMIAGTVSITTPGTKCVKGTYYPDLKTYDGEYDGSSKTVLQFVHESTAPTATVDAVTIDGVKDSPIAKQEVTIRLTNDQFHDITANTSVKSWFTNLPAGLDAKIKTAVNENDTAATIEISGTPSATSSDALAITIPAENLVTSTSDLNVMSNADAKYNITAPLTGISVKNAPTKTTYTAGENFDAAGMVIEATYSDGSKKDITGYTCTPTGALTTSNTEITISYTEGSETKTCTQTITVNAAPAEYTITFNGNGGTPSVGTMTTVGSKLTSLPTATHSGSYSFAGWYTAASGGTQITTAYVFSANTTVYAHWTYTGGTSGGAGGSSSGGGGGGYVPTTQKPEIKAAAGGKAELSKDGTTLTITADAGKVIDKVLLNGKDMGAVSELKGLKTGDKVEVIFKDQVTEPTKEELDKAAKEAAGELVLPARSAKLKNGSVKVVVKADLKAITDAGYTVKYKFYRSTKKSAGYKAMKTGKSGIYINTYGKKGTMYYYKARVMIYDKDGNFVAQTALKQCKYANRLWTK